MKVASLSLHRAVPVLLSLSCLLLCLPAELEASTWVGASADMSVAGNWDPSGVPSTSTGDTVLFNGSSTYSALTFPGGTFSGSDGLGSITVASGQTAALTIANSGAAGSVFRLRAGANWTIDAGAGAVTLGGSGNTYYLNLANSATGNQFINNSSNLATIASQVTINASGGSGGYPIFGGSGDWLVSTGLSNAATRGLAKNGTGTLTLAGNNVYAGPTVVNQGVLTLTGAGLTATSAVTVANGATLNLSGTGDNQLRGPWTVGGTLRVNTASAHTLYGDVTLNNGTMEAVGGAPANYGAFFLSASRTFTANGANNTVSGTGRLGIASGQTLTVSTPLASDALLISTPIGQGGSGTAGGLAKTGLGTLTLSAANTYTGPMSVLGGRLVLDYTAQDNSKLSDSAALVLGGGTLNLTGGSHAETVGSTTLQAATASAVTRSDGSAVLQMGAITADSGARVDFGAAGIARTDTLNTNGILGPWATIARTDWAANSTNAANGLITAPVYADVARLSSGPKVIASDPASNVRIVEGAGSAGPITLSAPTTVINSLNQSAVGGSSAAVIDPAGGTLAVNAILQGPTAGPLTIGTGVNNGSLRTATPGVELFLSNQSSAAMTIRSAIGDNGGSTLLTKVGPGTVSLEGVNTYTGNTRFLDAGTLRIGGAGQLGGGSYAGAISFAGSGSTFDYASSANQTLSGPISGSGQLAVTGSGTLTLSGVNTYAGATAVSGGTLKLAAPAVTLPNALSGLVVHLDAVQIPQAHNTSVATWANLIVPGAGGAGDFTASTGTLPTFVSDGGLLNGLPVVRFNNSATLRNLTNFGNNATVMYAGRMDGGANARLVGGTNNWLLGYHGGGQDKAHFNAWLYQPANVMDYAGKVYEVVHSGTTASVYSNGLLLAEGTNASFQGPNGLVLGGYAVNAETSYGSVGEVLVFNRALTPAERVQMEQYLAAKWYGPLPSTTALSITGGGVLDMDGVNQTLGSLAGDATGRVHLNGATLTVGSNNANTTYLGVIADGSTPGGRLAKTGTGTLTLGGDQSNTYSGTTILQAGRLQLAKTGGAYAVPGDFIGVHNLSPDVYATRDNQFAPGSVMYFEGTGGDHVRFELMGTTQTLAGVDNSRGRSGYGVIQHREQVTDAAVGTLSTLVLNGSGSYSFSGYLRDNGGKLALVKNGTGTQTLSGSNISYSGTTTVNEGVLNLTGGAYTSSTGAIVGPSGKLIVDTNADNRLRGWLNVAGTIEIKSTAAHTIGGDITLNNGTLDSGSDVAPAGAGNAMYGSFFFGSSRTVTANGAANVIKGANNTIGINNGVTVMLNTPDADDALAITGRIVAQNNAGNGGLAKMGAGTVTLSGTNSYLGATTVNNGTLVVRGSHTGGGAAVVNAGTLLLDLSANPTGVLGSASAPTLGGGRLLVQGAGSGASSQTLGNLTLSANTSSTVAVAPNGGAGTTLTLGNTWTRNANASVHFDLSAGTPATAVVASSPTLTNGIIGGWATVRDNAGVGFATVDAGKVVRYTGGTVLQRDSNDAAVNFTSTPTDPHYVAGTLTMDPGTHAVNTVAVNSGAGGRLNLNGTTLSAGGGLLFDGAGDYRVDNGTIGGAGAVSKFGSGTLTLATSSTYTGPTTIHDGTLKLENGAPALPVSAGLVARWDATAITGVADRAQLNTWTDSSSSGRNAVRQGGAPLYIADGGNGLPVVRFETSGDAWYNFAQISDIRTLFFVGKELSPGSSQNFFLGQSGSYPMHRGDNDYIWHGTHVSANIKNGQTYLNGQPVDGTTTTFGEQWTKLLEVVTAGNVAADQLSRDRNINGRSWRGDIGEILVFNQALSQTDRLAVERYLTNKWFGVLPTTTTVSLTGAGAAFDLNGVDQTIGALSGVAGAQVLLNGGTLTVGANNATTTFSGVIADGSTAGGGLTKDGSGDLVLAGGASNTYTGMTAVQGGRLGLSKSGGAYAIPGNIIGNHYYSPDIYTTADNQFAPGAVMYFQGNAGDHVRFELLGTTQTLAGIDNTLGRSGYGVIQHREQVATPAVGLSSTLVLNGSGTYYFDGYLRDSNGQVALVKDGSGTQTLANTVIDYTGATTVAGGTLRLLNLDDFHSAGLKIAPGAQAIFENSSRNFGRFTNTVIEGTGTFVKTGTASLITGNSGGYARWNMTGGLIDVRQGEFRADYQDQTVAWVNNKASMNVEAGAFVSMVGGNHITVDALTGAGTVQNINNWGTGIFTVGSNGGSGTFSGTLRDYGGPLALTKIGSGTQVLTGTSTYTGATTVSAGTLLVNGTIASSSGVSLAGGAVLGGWGAVPTVSGAGLVSPGASPGILTAPGINPAGGLDFAFEFTGLSPNFSTPASSVNDVLRLTGEAAAFASPLTSANRVSVYLDLLALGGGEVFTGGFFTEGTQAQLLLQLADADFVWYIRGDGRGSYMFNDKNYYLVSDFRDYGVTWSVTSLAGGEILTLATTVPEPMTMGLLLLGSLAVGRYARRRRSGK